jgi:hypothetical protein
MASGNITELAEEANHAGNFWQLHTRKQQQDRKPMLSKTAGGLFKTETFDSG